MKLEDKTGRSNNATKVQSLDRALCILDFILQYRQARIVTISRHLALHKSTVHRLLANLEWHGYVQKNELSNEYSLGLKLLELANSIIANLNIRNEARPTLLFLNKKTSETIHLAIRDGSTIVYIDKVDCNYPVRMASYIGMRSQLYSTALGKAILAFTPDEEANKIIEQNILLKRRTKNTITSVQELKSELKQIRSRGFAIDNEENEEGIKCVGGAIFNHEGSVVAGISISVPVTRMQDEKVLKYGNLIMKAVQRLSEKIGYKGQRNERDSSVRSE